jgi:Protein of unknown function (DUF998)
MSATSPPPASSPKVPAAARIAGCGGIAAFFTANLGWLLGGLAQPEAYSSTRDDISDLGALTADEPWLYNQIRANLSGLLMLAFAGALWWALSPDALGRVGASAVAVAGAGIFLDGMFRLDCRGIDTGCHNASWHSHAHKVESGVTGAALLAAPLILAFAFRRIPGWRGAWVPSLATLPLVVVANLVFSLWGDGAATRAATFVLTGWLAFASLWFLRTGRMDTSAARAS